MTLGTALFITAVTASAPQANTLRVNDAATSIEYQPTAGQVDDAPVRAKKLRTKTTTEVR